jgi:dihydrolipoamide dehydrogenase (EC 1.8.1.4)
MAYDEDGVVKGVEIVSQDANAMISEAALAIEMGATIEDIADTIHPHPTYSEAVQEAAEAAFGKPVHFFTVDCSMNYEKASNSSTLIPPLEGYTAWCTGETGGRLCSCTDSALRSGRGEARRIPAV